MKNKLRLNAMILAAALATLLASPAETWAQKASKPGGGGTSSPPRFSVIELPVQGTPVALSEPDLSDVVTVAIEGAGADRSSAAFAWIHRDTRTVLGSGLLPNGQGSPCDVNALGNIVGYGVDSDTTHATLWEVQGTGYSGIPLPSLPDSSGAYARGINNLGEIVGISNPWTAVRWEAATLQVVDLNSAATAALGWELRAAYDINDDGLIVGLGKLNGVVRGFLLDRHSGSIAPVPLLGSTTGNMAYRISATGRVVGDAWDGDGDPYGTSPDYYQSWSWNGPGTEPVVLPSLTTNTSLAAGINDLAASVGNSIVPGDGLFPEYVPTLWEFNILGGVTTTRLQSAISTSLPYTLLTVGDVNNNGWVAVSNRKVVKGKYSYPALLLVPSAN